MSVDFLLPGIGVRIERSQMMPSGSWTIIGHDGNPIRVVMGRDGRAMGPPINPKLVKHVVCAPDVYEHVMKMKRDRERAGRVPLDLRAN
jgi:hypothetical protein